MARMKTKWRECCSSTPATGSSSSPPIRSVLSSTLPVAARGGGSSGSSSSIIAVRRPPSNWHRKSGTTSSPPLPPTLSKTPGEGTLEEPGQSNNQAGQSRLPVVTPAGQGQDQGQGVGILQDPTVIAGSYSPSQDPPGDDDDESITPTTTVKTQDEVVLSSGVLVSDGTVGCPSDGIRRGGKRKGRVLPSSRQMSSAGGDASGGRSSRHSRSKRARAASGGNNVVLMDPGGEGVAATGTAADGGGAAAAGKGSRVAIKPERWSLQVWLLLLPCTLCCCRHLSFAICRIDVEALKAHDPPANKEPNSLRETCKLWERKYTRCGYPNDGG